MLKLTQILLPDYLKSELKKAIIEINDSHQFVKQFNMTGIIKILLIDFLAQPISEQIAYLKIKLEKSD